MGLNMGRRKKRRRPRSRYDTTILKNRKKGRGYAYESKK